MQYISSDTSVWIDFSQIDRIDLPFRLPYTYIMSEDAINDELRSPSGLRVDLLQHGLVSVEISIVEFSLAEEYGLRYQRLSIYDRVALAIAKTRQITLLTGDGLLRKVAKREGVTILGTLGLLDELFSNEYITKDEYIESLKDLQKHNGKKVRLPKAEITSRLQRHVF